ncbi:hypothetical protein SNEBB_001902 [Seison nebaliae]|nr:hypothetical protein SNEBB_001902 [Seison nebaliae]
MNKYYLGVDIGSSSIKCGIINEKLQTVVSTITKLSLDKDNSSSTGHRTRKIIGTLAADELWNAFNESIERTVNKLSSNKIANIQSIGLSVQRNSVTFWNKETGQCVHDFVMWNDDRSKKIADICNNSWKNKTLRVLGNVGYYLTMGSSSRLAQLADYQVASSHITSKILWFFEKYPDLKRKCQNKEYLFGGIDTYLLWKLTRFARTDKTCASSTGLYDPYKDTWSGPLCYTIGIQASDILPYVFHSRSLFGEYILGNGMKLPINCVIGDQQAALIGDFCTSPGEAKLTMGTGTFLDINLGSVTPSNYVKGSYNLIAWSIESELSRSSTFPLQCWLRHAYLPDYGNVLDETIRQYDLDLKDEKFIDWETLNLPDYFFIQVPNDFFFVRHSGSIMPQSEVTKMNKKMKLLIILMCMSFRTVYLLETHGRTLKRIRCNGGLSSSDFMLQIIATLTNTTVQRLERYQLRDDDQLEIERSAESAMRGAAMLASYPDLWANETDLKSYLPPLDEFKPLKSIEKKLRPLFNQFIEIAEKHCLLARQHNGDG